MKKGSIGKKVATCFLCMAMVITTVNLPALMTKVMAEETNNNIEWISVSSDTQLRNALANTGDVYIKMTGHITLDQPIEVNAGGNYKLDLNGKNLSCIVTDDEKPPQTFRIENSKMQIVNYSNGVISEVLCEKKNQYSNPPVCFRLLENSELTLGDEASTKIKILSKNEDRIDDNYIIVLNNNVQSIVTTYDCVQCGDTENLGRVWLESGNATFHILGGEFYGRVILTIPTCYINHAVFYSVLAFTDMEIPSIDSDAIIYNKYEEQENFEDFCSMVEVTNPKIILYNSRWDNEILADVKFSGMSREITKLKKMIHVYDDAENQVYEIIVPASDIGVNAYENIGYRENIFEYGKTYTIKVDFVNENGEVVRTINKSIKCDVTVSEGNCGPVSWKLIANGDFFMSGSGNMANTSTPALSESDLYRIRRIVVEDGVKSIESGVFGDLPNLQEVVIPDSVTDMASNIFGVIPADVIVKSKCDNAAVLNYVKATGMQHVIVHQNISSIPKVEATCTADGVKAYYKCACGKYYEDSDRTKEVTNFEAWKTGDGKIAKNDHIFDDGKVTKEATVTEEGVKTYTCSVCGLIKTETIPKKEATKPDDKTPKTPKKGDKVSDNKTKATYQVTNAVTSKEEVAYISCTDKKATKITVPDKVVINGVTYKVTKIKDKAFKNNRKIKTVIIGKNIATIGKSTFEGCKNLKTVTIKTAKLTDNKVGSKAFKGISANAKVKVPKAKLKAYTKILKKKGISGKNQKITK